MVQRIPMTPGSHLKLQEELKRLVRIERPKIVNEIAVARDHGDLSENAEYDAAKEKQGMTEARIAELNGMIALAQVIDPATLDAENIVFGATVTILDVDTEKEVTYQIVGEEESNIKEGKISVTSPVGRALIGHNIDDEVSIKVPSGVKLYEIVDITYR
jgi:transcription elongation factor GreA